MSGDLGGGIIGAAFMLPVVAAAGAGLVAYAAAKATFAVGRATVRLYQQHEQEVQHQLRSTEANINQFYRNMDAVLSQNARQTAAAAQSLERQFAATAQTLEAELNHSAVSDEDKAAWRRDIAARAAKAQQELCAKLQTAEHEIWHETDQQLQQMQSELLRQLDAQKKLDDLLAQDAANRGALEARVRQLLDQCRSALDQLSAQENRELIAPELSALEQSLRDAQTALQSGMPEAAMPAAQAVLRQAAALSITLARREQELHSALSGAYVSLCGVRELLQNCGRLSFSNPVTGEEEICDLDEFTRENYSQFCELTEKRVQALEQALGLAQPEAGQPRCRMTAAEARLLQQNVDQIVRPEAEAMLNDGIAAVGGYYERLNCMNIIAKEVTAQSGYQFSWCRAEADDLTAPLAMSLHNPLTGDSVVIQLDQDALGDGISMEAFRFDSEHTQSDPHYREHFRTMVVDSLRKHGLDASLTCTPGTETENSVHTDRRTQQQLAEKPLPDARPLQSLNLLK